MSRVTIANALKRLREKSGLTSNEVGEMLGKSGKTVNAWENNRGQPDAEMLIKLCDIYNVENILDEFRDPSESNEVFATSEKEKRLVTAYRSQPEMQSAVDKLLGIDGD
ncbi:MAG: helix-turn-helix domain-containing protein [Anaeromassilibacillus sp.]|nr:helix-turn-helix domain-containing protein [Anaeromassilibacillus sp.]MDY3780012.1 helix-turn-helix transcriptional regulator [Candidatus Limousia pullorum]